MESLSPSLGGGGIYVGMSTAIDRHILVECFNRHGRIILLVGSRGDFRIGNLNT